MNYIVKVDYYDWNGVPNYRCYVIDDAHTFYKAKDSEGKIKELINEINKSKDEEISIVDINVYELGNNVTNKFI